MFHSRKIQKASKYRGVLKISCLVLLLTLVFCFTAAGSASAKTVAQIGSKKYSSLQSAINKVKKGQTIVLKSNIDMKKKKLYSNRNVSYTINMNKKTIKNCNTFTISRGSVSIKNGTWNMLYYGHYGEEIILSKAKLYLTNMKFNNSEVKVKAGATLTVRSGTYMNFQFGNDGGKVVISGGSFRKMLYWSNTRGTVTINGGTFLFGAPQDSAIHIENEGTFYINKGTLKGTCYFFNYGKVYLKKSAGSSWKRYLTQDE